MKTLIRFVAGLALYAMAVVLEAQTPTLNPAAQGAAPELAPAAAITICGACGEQIHAPRPVYVAAPVNPRQAEGYRGYPPPAPGQSFYGIPPAGFVPQYPAAPCGAYPQGYYAPDCYRAPVAPRSVWGPGVIQAPRYPVAYPQGYAGYGYPVCR